MSVAAPVPRRLAFLVRDLGGGGVQRSMVTLAGAFAARGRAVDLVTCSGEGVLRPLVPPSVRMVVLARRSKHLARLLPLAADPLGLAVLAPAMLAKSRPSATIVHLPALAAYLRRERPQAMISGTTQLNLEAIWARRLARWTGRLVVTERVHLSTALAAGNAWRRRHLPGLVRRTYPFADAVVAVSQALAGDLAGATGLPRGLIATIHNPIVGPEVPERAAEPVPHPWFGDGGPPVVLAAGRLDPQKDFATLIRAFAAARRRRPLRLVILGQGARPELTAAAQGELAALAASLGVGDAVSLPGFAPNPLAYMARAALFVLSSRIEGLPAVLVQALACGCPVVSTDCPSGPAEILDGGRYGPLVPVADDAALAEAVLRTLDAPPPRELLIARARLFSVDRAVESYARLLDDVPLGRAGDQAATAAASARTAT